MLFRVFGLLRLDKGHVKSVRPISRHSWRQVSLEGARMGICVCRRALKRSGTFPGAPGSECREERRGSSSMLFDKLNRFILGRRRTCYRNSWVLRGLVLQTDRSYK